MMSPVLATIANELHEVLPALVAIVQTTAHGNPFKGWPEEKTKALRARTRHLLDLSAQKAFAKVQSIKDTDEQRYAAYRVWSTWVSRYVETVLVHERGAAPLPYTTPWADIVLDGDPIDVKATWLTSPRSREQAAIFLVNGAWGQRHEQQRLLYVTFETWEAAMDLRLIAAAVTAWEPAFFEVGTNQVDVIQLGGGASATQAAKAA